MPRREDTIAWKRHTRGRGRGMLKILIAFVFAASFLLGLESYRSAQLQARRTAEQSELLQGLSALEMIPRSCSWWPIGDWPIPNRTKTVFKNSATSPSSCAPTRTHCAQRAQRAQRARARTHPRRRARGPRSICPRRRSRRALERCPAAHRKSGRADPRYSAAVTRRPIISKAAEAMSVKTAPRPSAVAGSPTSPVLSPAAIAGTLKAR